MAESMKGLHRSHRCTEVSNANIGEKVTVMGWVQKRRNLGSLIFVDLRDRSGLLQIVFDTDSVGEEGFAKAETLGEYLDADVVKNMTEIATAVNATKAADFQLVFDPTLVRGMSYYTGTIFEIAMPEFGGACGGGGRYDKMVGKFTGNDVPACGFSIGFERIILLLMESGFQIPESPKKVAYLVEKNYPADKLVAVMQQAKEARENGQQILVVRMNKNKKFQKEQLTNEGYVEFVEFFNN